MSWNNVEIRRTISDVSALIIHMLITEYTHIVVDQLTELYRNH